MEPFIHAPGELDSGRETGLSTGPRLFLLEQELAAGTDFSHPAFQQLPGPLGLVRRPTSASTGLILPDPGPFILL